MCAASISAKAINSALAGFVEFGLTSFTNEPASGQAATTEERFVGRSVLIADCFSTLMVLSTLPKVRQFGTCRSIGLQC